MPEIRIALTFDDGPDGRPSASNNTRKVLNALTPPVPSRNICGTFFIQTHAPGRLPDSDGRLMAERAHREGHVLAIHTGSTQDHACHKNRVVAPTEIPGAANGLDSDMKRAKAAIREITGSDPKFVRATFGYTNQSCMNVYEGRSLRHVHWDIDSEDRAGQTAAQINGRLRQRTISAVSAGQRTLIYLFHDIQPVTGDNIGSFIETIRAAVLEAGHTPNILQFRDEVEQLLISKSGPGHDLPCPPGS